MILYGQDDGVAGEGVRGGEGSEVNSTSKVKGVVERLPLCELLI